LRKSAERASQLSQIRAGPGESPDIENDGVIVAPFDDKRFFTRLGVAGQSPIGEALPVWLVNDVHDPARGAQPQGSGMDAQHNHGVGLNRR
jgi:hypothetical protein